MILAVDTTYTVTVPTTYTYTVPDPVVYYYVTPIEVRAHILQGTSGIVMCPRALDCLSLRRFLFLAQLFVYNIFLI